jgi:gas vesicle protein
MAQDNSGKLVWFVAGAAIGATIALLYAPQPGHETRRIIGKKARRAGDTMAETGRDLADKGRDLADKGRDLYEKGRRVADDAAELFERGRKLVEG